MKRFFTSTFLLLLCLVYSFCFAQKKFTISGQIKDETNGEDIVGVSVYCQEVKIGTVSNAYGFYSLTLPEGTYTIDYKTIGYTTVSKLVDLTSNNTLTISLQASTQNLNEVIIESVQKNENVTKNEMSTVNLKMEAIKRMPALLGEVDVIKAIQLLPGVSTGGEGSSGFFVRGGASDQNLILLDEATVYNASHLMGFFSVFNQDAIKEAQLYKGGIPAQYGGRLSSVLDVRMKEGNNKTFNVTGGIGTISSRLTLEGPIVKEKGSFIISARRSYADLFLKFAKNKDLKNTQLFFYDLNGKANYTINARNRVYISAYTGRDVFKLGKQIGFNWGNQTITSRWNHLFSSKLFSNITLIASHYNYNLESEDENEGFKWSSGIKDIGIKNDFNYYLGSKNSLKFGFSAVSHKFSPATIEPNGANSIFKTFNLPTASSIETAAYVSNDQKIGEKLLLSYGIRYSQFFCIGPATVYHYNANYDTTGFTKYNTHKSYKQYGGWEPRGSVTYIINQKNSIKASYNKMYQYIHLASNSTNSTPLDLWIMSSPNIKPQVAQQFALGYFKNIINNTLEISVEAYYKNMNQQIDFKDRANLLFNPLLEGELRVGKAKSYGAEFLIRKQEGKLNGWLSYTLSKAERTVAEINFGKTYLANYDRRHNISLVISYDINQRVSLSSNFVYSTGLPVTAPTGRFEYEGVYAPIYSDRNGTKMPDYHRLDFAATLKNKKRREAQRFNSAWVFSVYNAYNRKNAYSINFKQNEQDKTKTEAVMTYLFPILPAITYNFNF